MKMARANTPAGSGACACRAVAGSVSAKFARPDPGRMRNVPMTEKRQLPTLRRGVVFLLGAIFGVAVATAWHAARAHSKALTNEAVPSVTAPKDSELPKTSHERTSDVIRQSRGSVCLIEGTFIFRDRATGEPLRRKQWIVTGNDDTLENPFSGTGFLASSDGAIVTNRHVAVPWSSDPEAELLMSRGYRPVLTKLIAYFPGSSNPVRLRVVRVAKRNDAAIVAPEPHATLPRPLPLAPENTAAPGERVTLLGYPAGVRAILARNRVNLDRISPRLDALSDEQISRTLATRHAIEPFASVGYISNSEGSALTISAFAGDGSSGSPVLNEDGQVVGVVRASLTLVENATLAVPAGVVRELLASIRDAGL